MEKEHSSFPVQSIPMTRHTLMNNLVRDYLCQHFPNISLASEEALKVSIQHMLDTRPEEAAQQGGVYLFAYGSLIWNPCVEVDDRKTARLYGYHRDFCLELTHGRGSPEHPGLMLALKQGGSCRGVAIHMPESNLAEELLLVWRREMLTKAYYPRWVKLATDDQEANQNGRLWAIVFVANTHHERYVTDLTEETVIHKLKTGYGVLGSCQEYLANTIHDLRSLNIHDRKLEQLAARVEASRV